MSLYNAHLYPSNSSDLQGQAQKQPTQISDCTPFWPDEDYDYYTFSDLGSTLREEDVSL